MYINGNDAKLLLNGFQHGFSLQYTGPRVAVKAKNLVSADIHKNETLAKLQNEVMLGRMIGPFSTKPISMLRISPIGLVSKSDGGWCLITHLSFPEGSGVNAYIAEEYCKVKYSSFDGVLDMISSLGKGAELGKIDIKQAFRLLIVNPTDFDLLGIQFEGKYWVDKNLPMGCSISCSLFEKFATFLHWVVQSKTDLDTLDHYLDDFIFAGANGSGNCALLMDAFKHICQELGVPLADNKTVGPTTLLTFLGLLIDTVNMIVKIPVDKVERLKFGINLILNSNKMKVKDFESIIGLMAFCARAIPSGRAFLRRFYDVLSCMKVRKSYYYIRISKEVKADALVWQEILESFNGECYLPDRIWISSETLELFTDSAGSASLGCGAYLSGHWAQFRWPAHWEKENFMKDISFLELVPIILAFHIWTPRFINKKILLRIDNQALVAIVNNRTSKSKYIMQLVRPLVLLCMRSNIQVRAKHISGVQNELADCLSRFQMDRFKKLAPMADQTPSDIPAEFWSMISKLK